MGELEFVNFYFLNKKKLEFTAFCLILGGGATFFFRAYACNIGHPEVTV